MKTKSRLNIEAVDDLIFDRDLLKIVRQKKEVKGNKTLEHGRIIADK